MMTCLGNCKERVVQILIHYKVQIQHYKSTNPLQTMIFHKSSVFGTHKWQKMDHILFIALREKIDMDSSMSKKDTLNFMFWDNAWFADIKGFIYHLFLRRRSLANLTQCFCRRDVSFLISFSNNLFDARIFLNQKNFSCL